MHKISIRPHWTISHGGDEALGARLIELLVCVAETGSIAAACRCCAWSAGGARI